MIIFQKISWKNFLSTGNVPNILILNDAPSTLIIGKNGAGKSSLLDALTFVLFGKPFRKINKPNLLNSINGKQCRVEVDFSIDDTSYRVVRGIKPNVFEIWRNGVLVNQEASGKDYQKVLEQQILRLTYKSFTQVVILGSASFVPFMQLSESARREVIEDILDIRIFSIMNGLLKIRAKTTKEEVDSVNIRINRAKEQVAHQKKLIKTIDDAREHSIEKLEEKIQSTLLVIESETQKCNEIQKEIADIAKEKYWGKGVDEEYLKAKRENDKIKDKIESIKEYATFVSDNTDCPSCGQSITHDHKLHSVKESWLTIHELQNKSVVLDSKLVDLHNTLKRMAELDKLLNVKTIDMSTSMNTINILNRQVADYNKDIQDFKHTMVDSNTEKDKLKSLASSAMDLINTKNGLAEQRGLQDIASVLLKDTGIKTAVIREYLPIMNKWINHYLRIMESYIQLELDENFNEVIRSRYRDEFTYFSFSEGEKSRINLALLFVWRKIAKMKNSINTNLLIFDEIFDSSLDMFGTENFIQLLEEEGHNSNIFVITHKDDAFSDKFARILRIEKPHDFSVIKQDVG